MSAASPEEERTHVVVVTGLSGAGKSTALHALEDLGYFCVDNLPPPVLARTVELCEEGGMRRVGVGVDVRASAFLEGAVAALEAVRSGRALSVVFLEASDEMLVRRFSETRRPHPLTTAARGSRGASEGAQIGAVAVLDGVQLERARLAPLRANATLVVDTTALSVHDLRRRVVDHLGPGKGIAPRMLTRMLSFGFKYGLPVDADVVLDVRHLENPYFVPELKHLPGTEPQVRDFVLGNRETAEFLRRAVDLLALCMPRYEREGKSYLTVAIGCTGGRHRSVAVAEAVAERLRGEVSLPIAVVHRDVARGDRMEPDLSSSRRGDAAGGGQGEGS